MNKQVDKSHYAFGRYVSKLRWASIWHQLDEVININPARVLEIGPGPGLFKAAAAALGVHVETLDLDPELNPDHVASVFEMPFSDDAFDVVCAFQMLEHLPFEESLDVFAEIDRVAKRAVILSLPDSAACWPIPIYIPRVGLRWFHVPRPRLRKPKHRFDGEHYWELNKDEYCLRRVTNEFQCRTEKKLQRTYRVDENPYHRFFIWRSVDHID